MTDIITNFTTPGSDVPFLVPAGVTQLLIYGSGGDGGRSNTVGSPSGRGATLTAKLAVTPGETLTIRVGGVGGTASSSATLGTGAAGYPDGGVGGIGPSGNRGGGGGGSTKILRGATVLLTVAGGGGASSRMPNTGPVLVGDGSSPNLNGYDGSLFLGGHGATPTAGGAAGGVNSTAGSLGAGGNGAVGTGVGGVGSVFSGGGGGGGLYGGGGGDRSSISVFAGGGGGGISFIATGQGWSDVIWASDVRSNTILETTTLISGFNGFVQITYTAPVVGGWSLGLASLLG